MESNLPPPCNWSSAHASLVQAHTQRGRTHTYTERGRALFTNLTCWQRVGLSYALGAALPSISPLMTISVWDTIHVSVCSRVTSAPSHSLLAVTWSLQIGWMKRHKKLVVFGFHSMVRTCLGWGWVRVAIVVVTFARCYFSLLVILTPIHIAVLTLGHPTVCIYNMSLHTYLKRLHWCFVRICYCLWWPCTESLWQLLYIYLLNISSVVARRAE